MLVSTTWKKIPQTKQPTAQENHKIGQQNEKKSTLCHHTHKKTAEKHYLVQHVHYFPQRRHPHSPISVM